MAIHSSILAGKYHGQRSLVGYGPRGQKRVEHKLVIKQQQQCYTGRLHFPILSTQILLLNKTFKNNRLNLEREMRGYFFSQK